MATSQEQLRTQQVLIETLHHDEETAAAAVAELQEQLEKARQQDLNAKLQVETELQAKIVELETLGLEHAEQMEQQQRAEEQLQAQVLTLQDEVALLRETLEANEVQLQEQVCVVGCDGVFIYC